MENLTLSDGFYRAKAKGGFTRFIAVKGERSVLTWVSDSHPSADLYTSLIKDFSGFDEITPCTKEEFLAEVDRVTQVVKNVLGV